MVVEASGYIGREGLALAMWRYIATAEGKLTASAMSPDKHTHRGLEAQAGRRYALDLLAEIFETIDGRKTEPAT